MLVKGRMHAGVRVSDAVVGIHEDMRCQNGFCEVGENWRLEILPKKEIGD